MSRRRSVATKPPQHVPHRPGPRRTDSAPHSSEMPGALAHFQRLANDSGPVQRLRSLQQSASEGGPIQRVLSHTTPIVGGEVKHVKNLAPKVFRLDGDNGASVIIKFEMTNGNETLETFGTRDQITRELGGHVLDGVPGGQAATPHDIGVLNALSADNVTGDLAGLKQAIALPLPPNMLVLKGETVDVGKNLASALKSVNKKLKKGGKGLPKAMQEAGSLNTQISSPAMCNSMGRMAAFDMVVNNYDRFRPNGTVNLVNLDINATQALGIDNLNPWDPVTANNWEGQQKIADNTAVEEYTADIVGFLLDEMAIEQDKFLVMAQNFKAGMVLAIQTLKTREAPLRLQIAAEMNAQRSAIMTVFANRLAALPNL